MLAPSRVLLASHNPGKIREIAELLSPYVAEVTSARAYGLPEPEERGESFMQIAELKARAAAEAVGLASLADDSGLVVPALGGDPGVRSARWGGPDKDFALAMRRVHEALGERPREATMVTALALAWPDGEARVFEGRVHGALVWPPRGELGFGYEPMFRPDGETRTYGEMPREEKHADDPRARAFAQLAAACLQRRD